MTHRITLGIGLLTIVLPLIFWGKIPSEIPIHYDASGVADNYADKSSLILVVFAVGILMGVMNIAIYFVKTSAASKYATEAEKSQMDVVYPIVIFLNLAVQVVFAYIMFCCTTGRDLGSWFMVVSLVATFAPLVFLAVKRPKAKTEKQTFTTNEGIVYRSKVDWWLGLILLVSVGAMIWATLEPIVNGRGVDWVITISMVLTLVIVLPLFFIKYVLYPDHLFVSCGFYIKARISYESICRMKETRNPLSSAAMSVDRIQIDYVENGVHRMVLISPVRKKEFMEQVEKYRSRT